MADTVLMTDDFTGTTGSSWSNTRWGTSAQSGSGITISGNRGQMVLPSTSNIRSWAWAYTEDSLYGEVVVTINKGASSRNSFIYVTPAGDYPGNATSASNIMPFVNGVAVYTPLNSTTSNSTVMIAVNNGVVTTGPSVPIALALNQDYRIRVRRAADYMKVKIWPTNVSEPTDWTQTWTPTAGVFPTDKTNQRAGLGVKTTSGSTNGTTSALFDDFSSSLAYDDVSVSVDVPTTTASATAVEAAVSGSAKIDLPTVTATIKAPEATQVSPLPVSVDVDTAVTSADVFPATYEERQHPILGATLERYANGTSSFDSASNIVGEGGFVYAAGLALPGTYTNAGLVSAKVRFAVNGVYGSSVSYRIHRITQPWDAATTTYDLSTDFVSVNLTSTGSYVVDVASLMRKTNFYGLAFVSNSANSSDYAVIPDGTSLDLYYAVRGESVTVEPDTAAMSIGAVEAAVVIDVALDLTTPGASVSASEATAEATTAPSTTVDVGTALVSAQAPEAAVVIPVTVDLSETPTAALTAVEADVVTVANAAVDLETPTTQVTLVKLLDVNGEPVLPSETEDPYFVSTMRTTNTGDTWWRLNEAAGTKVANRANPTAPWPATGTGSFDGVTLGLFGGPEGRRSVYFNGASLIEENEPTSTNLDEVFYSPNVLEFTFKTERGTQFIMGGADNAGTTPGSGVSTPVAASEFWLVDGKINFRAYTTQAFTATPALNTNITGFRNLADDQWHHVVINAGVYNFSRGSRAVEIYVDGKLEIRRFAGVQGTSANETVETGVVYFGSPDYIGGRGEFVDGRRLPILPVSQWFQGHLTEVVFRNQKLLSEDEVLLQRDNMFGIRPVYVEPARAKTQAVDASAKGNKTRILVLDFQTSASLLINQDYKGVGPMPGRDAFGRIVNAPPYETQFDFPSLTSALGDTYGVEAYQIFTAKVRNGYTDPVTDNERVVDLDLDINLDDYDVLAIGGFPQNDREWEWYTGLDAYSTAPFVPGRRQVETLIGQVREKAIAGKPLFVNDPASAVMLGIVDRVEYVANMREKVINDVRLGAVANLYDRRAAEIDAWNVNTNRAVTAERYRDQHANTRQRVRALVDGLTTVPSFITTEYFEWYNTDPFATPPMNSASKYADRTKGLFVGDEFYMQGAQGPGVLDAFDEIDGTPSVGGKANGWLATPLANVKAGKAVTTFANKVYNLDRVDDNPYKDYAVSIVVEPGDQWAGRTSQGKVYVNFTEAFTQWAMFFETALQQVRPASDPIHPQTPEQNLWDFSTYRGTWTGTTVNPNQASGGGEVSTNGTSGAVSNKGGTNATKTPNITSLVTFAWKSWWDTRNVDIKGMAHRGLTWLATGIAKDGNVSVNVQSAEVSTAAVEPAVQANRSEVVDVSTARAQTEAYKDADTIGGDSTVLVTTPTVSASAGAFREVVNLTTATVSAKAVEPQTNVLEGLEIIRLVLPRHTVTLYMEET